MRKDAIIFFCNICGLRSPEPVLCVKPGCPTEALVYGIHAKPVVLSRAN
jgi:hypothetical protein